jgi:nucleotide-binding universal stress UspA family protein
MPSVPQSVLAAVDFGDASARAVALAGFIADRCGAVTFRLLHTEAAEAPAYFTHQQIEALERQHQAMRAQAERYLAEFGRRHTTLPLSPVVDEGSPSDAIVREATTADLVVMGTHGRHGPKRWWLGSVAERVLREIHRPLLVVRADTPGPVEAVFSRVLVHAAPPLVGDGVLDYARQLTACFSGEVVDGRGQAIESAVAAARATLLVVAAPLPRTAGWLSQYGDSLVRFCTIPILFVPEVMQGAASS